MLTAPPYVLSLYQSVRSGEKAERAMAVLDQINAKFGRGTVGVDSAG
ncbi:DUF4113 domain-containing protein [Stenotrophomonas hibiscicola]